MELPKGNSAVALFCVVVQIHSMNHDSRNVGKGSKRPKAKANRRVIHGQAEQVPKLPPERTSPDLEPPKPLTREDYASMALDELAAAAVDAAKLIANAGKQRGKKRLRGQGQQETSARWLLQQVLDRVAPVQPPQPGEPGATGTATPVDELAARREALRDALRAKRLKLNQ